MKHTEGKGFEITETPKRALAVAAEFKQFIGDNPGVMAAAKKLCAEADAEYNPQNLVIGDIELRFDKRGSWELIRIGNELQNPPKPLSEFGGRMTFLSPTEPKNNPDMNLRVTMLGKADRLFTHHKQPILERSNYFKIERGNKTFFAKRSTATLNPGREEFINTRKAKEILNDLPFVKVVEAQLGYQSQRDSWFVAEWEDLENEGFASIYSYTKSSLDDYGKEVALGPAEKLKKMKKQAKVILDRLAKAGLQLSDRVGNLFYNPISEKFILLDVTTAVPDGETGLNQPKKRKNGAWGW